MKIHVYDTLTSMRAVLETPVEKRKEAYREFIIEPLRDYWQPTMQQIAAYGQEPDEDTLRSILWNFDFQEKADDYLAALKRLEEANAWGIVKEAVERSVRAIEAEGYTCSLERMNCLLTLGNPRDEHFMQWLKGSVGAGSNDGFVVLIWPTDENLPRLGAVAAHEFHHKVRMAYEPWTAQTTVGDYIVLEGMAESFATALYGEQALGPWVTNLSATVVESSGWVISKALDQAGDIRGYMFGDQFAEQYHYPPVGVPYCAGYAVGYQVMQAYLHRTGNSVVKATFTPSKQIVQESQWFTK